jgi:hypothetical protein
MNLAVRSNKLGNTVLPFIGKIGVPASIKSSSARPSF